MDFDDLGPMSSAERPVHPIEIFEKLPNLPGTPNDIWRGQTEALEGWHANRTKSDVLVSLNTGAGKTLVGLLIAQSLVNEGVQNVVYVCATIDLVNQTAKEAEKIGLEFTTRVEGGFSNDSFEIGKAFCITTYHAIFNGFSSIRRKYFPGAVIFDDAHVADSVLRQSYTIHVKSSEEKLFSGLVELFSPYFSEIDQAGAFKDAYTGNHPKIMLVSPGAVRERKDQLVSILERHGIADHDELKYPWNHIRDRLDRCAVLFGHGACEITPPFLPALAMDVLERPNVRRIYLSATLRYKTDFIRAFGREPVVCIEPKNDAGNGERLILFGRQVIGGIEVSLVEQIAREKKIVVAVPSGAAA